MIDEIKKLVKDYQNKEVKVISKENRNRNDIFYGIITQVYPHVFIVTNGIETKSFSYADILSRDITITYW